MHEIHIPEPLRGIPETEAKERTSHIFEFINRNEYIIESMARDAAEKAVSSAEAELAASRLYVPGQRDFHSREKKQYFEELCWDNFDAFVSFAQSCTLLSSRVYTDTIGFFEKVMVTLKQVDPDEFTQATESAYGGLDKDNIRHVVMYLQMKFDEEYMDQESGLVREIVREYILDSLGRESILEIIRGNPNYAKEFAGTTP